METYKFTCFNCGKTVTHELITTMWFKSNGPCIKVCESCEKKNGLLVKIENELSRIADTNSSKQVCLHKSEVVKLLRLL